MAAKYEQEPLSAIAQAREIIVLAISILERRWRYLVAPVAITLVLALIAVKLSPTTYTTRALLLIQSANRPAGAGLQSANTLNRQVVLDQVAALDTWLKSDEVLVVCCRVSWTPAPSLRPRVWRRRRRSYGRA